MPETVNTTSWNVAVGYVELAIRNARKAIKDGDETSINIRLAHLKDASEWATKAYVQAKQAFSAE